MNEDITRAEDVDDKRFAISSEQRRIQIESKMCREDAQVDAQCSSIGGDDDSSTSSCASIDTNVFSDEDEELGAPKFSPRGKFLHYEKREDDTPVIMMSNIEEVSCQKTIASNIRKNRRMYVVLIISLLAISFSVVIAINFFSGKLFGESNKSNKTKLQLPSSSMMTTTEDTNTKHTHPKYPHHEHPKHTHQPDHKHTHHQPQKENGDHTHPKKEHTCRNCSPTSSSVDTLDTVSVRPFKHGEEVPWERNEAQD